MTAMSRVAIGLCLGLLVLSLAFTAYSLRHEPTNPLRYSDPQMIVGSKVLHRGEEFQVQRTKCNDSDQPLAVLLISSDWRQKPGGSGTPYRVGTQPLVLGAHECNERTGINVVPPDMGFGFWVLEGLDCVVPEHKICRAWKTESFEVVP